MTYQALCQMQNEAYRDIICQLQAIQDLEKQASTAGEGTYLYQLCNQRQKKSAQHAMSFLQGACHIYDEYNQPLPPKK